MEALRESEHPDKIQQLTLFLAQPVTRKLSEKRKQLEKPAMWQITCRPCKLRVVETAH